jgi:hypothetical protein
VLGRRGDADCYGVAAAPAISHRTHARLWVRPGVIGAVVPGSVSVICCLEHEELVLDAADGTVQLWSTGLVTGFRGGPVGSSRRLAALWANGRRGAVLYG